MTHKQIHVFNPIVNRHIEVDEGISDLLRLLWDRDIFTLLSCQGGSDIEDERDSKFAFIMFSNPSDVGRFLESVAQYPETTPFWETRYARILGQEYNAPNAWIYEIFPVNLGVNQFLKNNEVIETFSGENNFSFNIIVRFPHTDIPEIVKMLETRG